MEAQLERFSSLLENLLDISASTVIDNIQEDLLRLGQNKQEDIKFLLDQRSEQKLCLSKVDNHYVEKVVEKNESAAR